MFQEFYWLNYLIKYKLFKRKNEKLEKLLLDMDDTKLWVRDNYRLCSYELGLSIWIANSEYGIEIVSTTDLITKELRVPPEYKYLIWKKFKKVRYDIAKVDSIFTAGNDVIVKLPFSGNFMKIGDYLTAINKSSDEKE